MRLDTIKSKEKGLFVSLDPTPCFTFPIYIKTLDYEFFSKALLDTRVSPCFMDNDFAIKHSLELIGKTHSPFVEVIDGWPLASVNVMEETQLLEVMLGDLVLGNAIV